MDATKPYRIIGLSLQYRLLFGLFLDHRLWEAPQRLGDPKAVSRSRAGNDACRGPGSVDRRDLIYFKGGGGRPGIYLRAVVPPQRGPDRTPNLLSPLVYFHPGSTFNDRPVGARNLPDFRLGAWEIHTFLSVCLSVLLSLLLSVI